MPTSLVYAYGSNLCMGRMRARAPSAQPLVVAELVCHRLQFHKRGRDGSGKADAFFTGRAGDSLWGIVFRMETSDRRALDLCEGEGSHYDAVRRTVRDGEGGSWDARLYRACPDRIAEGLLPFAWYKRLLLEGAHAAGLPRAYIERVEAMASRADPDRMRAREQLRVLDEPGSDTP